MNLAMIRHLVGKDFSQSKAFILMYSVLGVMSALMALIGGETAFYISTVLVITCLVGIGLHPMFVHVLMEKKDQNFAFVMSLPVSHTDYTVAKILAVYFFAIIPWMCVIIASSIVVLVTPTINNGFLGPALVVALEIFAGYSVALSVALILSSEAAIVVAIVAGNIFVNFFIMGFFRLADVQSAANSPVFVWNQTLTNVVLVELVLMVVLVGLTCFLQSRKKDLI